MKSPQVSKRISKNKKSTTLLPNPISHITEYGRVLTLLWYGIRSFVGCVASLHDFSPVLCGIVPGLKLNIGKAHTGTTASGCHTVPIINLRPSASMIYSRIGLRIGAGSATGNMIEGRQGNISADILGRDLMPEGARRRI